MRQWSVVRSPLLEVISTYPKRGGVRSLTTDY